MTSNKFRPWIGIHKRSFNPASSTINFKSIDKPKEKRGPKKEIIIALLPNRPWHRENDANNLNHNNNNNIQIVKKNESPISSPLLKYSTKMEAKAGIIGHSLM